jgi:uncharacterized Zn finger protein
MNIKGKCVNRECPRLGIEETYTRMLLAGLSAGEDRVRCPECGQLLQVTETVNTAGRRLPESRVTPRRNRERRDGRRQSRR